MKKENYCKLVRAIQQRRDDDLKLSEIVKPYIGICGNFHMAKDFVKSTIDVMLDETHDKDGYLDWWLDGGRYTGIGKGDLLLDTPGDLFDFLNGDL